MGKLVRNDSKEKEKTPKKDKIIFGVLLALGVIPLLLMIVMIILLIL